VRTFASLKILSRPSHATAVGCGACYPCIFLISRVERFLSNRHQRSLAGPPFVVPQGRLFVGRAGHQAAQQGQRAFGG
jgi:hypothetical protein